MCSNSKGAQSMYEREDEWVWSVLRQNSNVIHSSLFNRTTVNYITRIRATWMCLSDSHTWNNQNFIHSSLHIRTNVNNIRITGLWFTHLVCNTMNDIQGETRYKLWYNLIYVIIESSLFLVIVYHKHPLLNSSCKMFLKGLRSCAPL